MTLAVTFSGPEDTGLGPQVVGDPVIALFAQLNRFAGRMVSPTTGAARHYVAEPFSLGLVSALPEMIRPAAIDLRAAMAAVSILIDRYQLTTDTDSRLTKWAISSLDSPQAFVRANIDTIVPIIAQYGDSLGLDPAAVGITTRDGRFTKASSAKTVVAVVSAVAIIGMVALAFMRRG